MSFCISRSTRNRNKFVVKNGSFESVVEFPHCKDGINLLNQAKEDADQIDWTQETPAPEKKDYQQEIADNQAKAYDHS